MYINHAGCVILQVQLWILEKKLNYNLFHFNNDGYNDIRAKEESNSLQKIKYVTTFYSNASQRKINFAVTPSKLMCHCNI